MTRDLWAQGLEHLKKQHADKTQCHLIAEEK